MSKETSDNIFKLLGKEIAPGQSEYLEMEVAKLHTRNNIRIPIIVERSKKSGPIVLLMGGLHGDEVNGIAIVRKVIKEKLNKPIRGTIICIPVFNVFGYLSLTREFPDGRDLNRVFPGSSKGSLASQFAYQFTTNIAPLVDYILDFHTGGADRENFPQVRCVVTEKKTMELAKIFGAPFILDSKYIPKSVRETTHKMGKALLLYEGGKSKSLDDSVIEIGVKGAANVLRHLKVISGSTSVNEPIVVKKSKWLRAAYSGMFHLKVKNGAFIEKGSIMGIISDVYGDFDKMVRAPIDCYVLCVNTTPIVNKGDALFHVSVESDRAD
ncbi:MAG: succinylglutamate desuccinylase/aspartoacylase family protein [Chitinophagales bacterium]|nr:succinylglutamate desuccinylase/aspartoacylase family protein [Chitinophagales bacterium]